MRKKLRYIIRNVGFLTDIQVDESSTCVINADWVTLRAFSWSWE